jgi:CBS domain-containing protein
MQAQDVMTRNVVTVDPDDAVPAIARLLLDRSISGVPVVDGAGTVLGVVTEADLLRRPENQTEPVPKWWLRGFADNATLALAYTKSHGQHARDVMSRPAVTAPPTMPVGELAALMERRHIKRVPIVEDGRLVGIVTRANLLRGIAGMRSDPHAPRPSDREIHDKLMQELRTQDWVSPWLRTVTVDNGTVGLWGFVASEAERRALQVAAERIPGVVAIEDHLTLRSPRRGLL